MFNLLNILIITLLIFGGILNPQLGLVLLVLAGGFVLLCVGLHIYVYAGIYISGIKLQNRLHKQMRTITLEEAKQNIYLGQRTIIIEAPTLGWNVNRLWWCPDHSPSESKIDFEKDPEAYIQEASANYNRFISAETGSAKIFDIFLITQRTEKYLIKHFGNCDLCFVPSGWVIFYQNKLKREK